MISRYKYDDYFAGALDRVKGENRYRSFLNLKKRCSPMPCFEFADKKIDVWCSNDYLGMSCHPGVVEAVSRAAYAFGAGSGGTRNISGTNNTICDLESALAELHNKERALLFSSGYIANTGSISSLGRIIPGLVIFSDQDNHASLIEGIRLSGARKVIFNHNDMLHLETLLKQEGVDTPKLIIYESIYSMSGDIAPMRDICALAKAYNALTFVDEVHAVGMYGCNGGGVSMAMGLQSENTIIQGTLSKAYGVVGGYVASSDIIIDCIRSYASSFIFTTSLPPPIAEAARTSVDILKNDASIRSDFFAVVETVKSRLVDAGVIVRGSAESHIIPIMIGDSRIAESISSDMFNNFGIFVQHINYPTVPVGTERLRVTPNRLHAGDTIDRFVEAIAHVMSNHGLLSGDGILQAS